VKVEAMTEDEWLQNTDPAAMLAFLRASGRTSERKLRLFAAASFRRLIALLPDSRQRRGIELLEQLAEGSITRDEARAMIADVRRAIPPDDWVAGMPPTDSPHYIALMLYREFCSSSIAAHAVHAAAGLADSASERIEQVRLIGCIFGNAFRPATLDRAWLHWNDGTVGRLAQVAYEERELPSGHLDPARLGVLADALEEAGADADPVGHLREPGPHVRGCRVLDLLTGR
jgi:hypothetical protein